MTTLFDEMLAGLSARWPSNPRGAMQEVMQRIALVGLSRAGLFRDAAFYGGTCLRLFHGLGRFSEDMDFTLLGPRPDFRLETCFPALIRTFALCGRTVTVTAKEKSRKTDVKSAFLKDTTDRIDLAFTSEPQTKVKIEIDTNPPAGFSTESRVLVAPTSCMIRCGTLSSLFAGKLHAVLFRHWANRIKGRDWYDFAWFVAKNVPVDLPHLQARVRQTNPDSVPADLEGVRAQLLARIEEVDFEAAKFDVMPFLGESGELDVWSGDYFRQLVALMR